MIPVTYFPFANVLEIEESALIKEERHESSFFFAVYVCTLVFFLGSQTPLLVHISLMPPRSINSCLCLDEESKFD